LEIISKTWNDFWGEFLLITFHRDNPNKWKPVEKKAEWTADNASLQKDSTLLDLGCGSGMLDICLAKAGILVTAIDRIKPVLEIARKEAGSLPVEFVHGDIKQVSYPGNSFDCILILETLGLMDKADDIKLICNAFNWLNKNGILIVDCPEPSKAGPNYWEKEFPEGLLKFETIYEPGSSIQTIIPIIDNEKHIIQLNDQYSNDKGIHTGVKRYLYSESELCVILTQIGFEVNKISHYWGDKYFALKGIKR